MADPEYWVEQVREPVRFADALAALDGVTTFLELGPDAVLTALAPAAARRPVCVPLLRRDRDEAATALTALAALHVHGVPVDWRRCFAGARVVDLPTYAFQRQRYWLEQPAGTRRHGRPGRRRFGPRSSAPTCPRSPASWASTPRVAAGCCRRWRPGGPAAGSGP